MGIPYHLPEVLGGVTEAQLLQWLVSPGDQVEKDQLLCEVQNDKALIELPSPQAGVIEKLCVEAGDTITNGQMLLHFDLKSARLSDEKRLATPSVRRLAREHQVRLADVKGSGINGRILTEDVQTHVRKQSVTNVEQLTPYQQAVARNLTQSVQEKPHVTHFDVCDVSGLVSWYEQRRSEGITYTPLILKIVAQALIDHPRFNAHYHAETHELVQASSVSLGIATHTDYGLVVPVIHRVEEKNIEQIQQELTSLIHRARQGELPHAEMKGSTFTISNAGAVGGQWATPIIQGQEVAILATHRVERRPVVTEQGEIESSWQMNLSLSFDHRVLDGVDAIRFTQSIGKYAKEIYRLI